MEYEMKCEITRCSICGEWIEYSKTRTIIKKKHYHKNCIISLYHDFLYHEFLHKQTLELCLNP